MERYKEERRSMMRAKYKSGDDSTPEPYTRKKKLSASSSQESDSDKPQPGETKPDNPRDRSEEPLRPSSASRLSFRSSQARISRESLKVMETQSPKNRDSPSPKTRVSSTLNVRESPIQAGSPRDTSSPAPSPTIVSSSKNGGAGSKNGGGGSSPVTLRHKAPDVWKLVDLKQPEPSGFSRGSPRSSEPLPKGSPRSGKDVWSRSPRPSELPLEHSSQDPGDVVRINFGQIDDSVNVKERASMFGSRRPDSVGNTVKPRTVSIGSCGPTDTTRVNEHKPRTVSVGSMSFEAKRKGTTAGIHPTSPSKIKNMAALFENKA